MNKYIAYLDKVSEGLLRLSEDTLKMAENHKELQRAEQLKEETGEEVLPRKLNMKSFQPVTRLRKNKEELKAAQENPEITFINDKLKDIYKW